MHDFDNMIERYRKELLEFSKQVPVHNIQEPVEAVPAMNSAETAQSSDTAPVEESPQEDDVQEYVVLRPYSDEGDFNARNDSQGTLRVQVFAAGRSFPVSGADVTVEVPFLTGSKELFKGKTDRDGIADGIALPAPSKNLSLDETNTKEPFALYNVRISHPDYAMGEYSNVPVFDSVKSIQPVELVPLTQSGDEPGDTVFGGDGNG